LIALCKQPITTLKCFFASGALGDRIKCAIYAQNRDNALLLKDLGDYKILLNCRHPSFSAWIAATGMYELETSILFKLLAMKSQVIIDVGAGIGWYSLLGSSVLHNKGKILSIEPDPSNVLLIKKSVRLNQFSNVEVIDACISDFDGKIYLNLANDAGYNSIKNKAERGKILCVCKTLNSLIQKRGIEVVDLLKVDVEGAEPEVLAGSKELIQSQRILNIIAEWNPSEWKDKEDLLELLFNNYRCFKITPTRFLSRVNLQRILKPMEVDEALKYVGNVLFINLEKYSNAKPTNRLFGNNLLAPESKIAF
jgi:FkbM family methyltransferase